MLEGVDFLEIKVNEMLVVVKTGSTIYDIRDKFKKNADIVILNGYPIGDDKELLSGDKVVLIERGESPKEEELEALMVSRHTPGIHECLKKGKVAIAGAGGLGSNIAISLARLGVGEITIVDFDVVEPSNLNRQQYYIDDIGKFKVQALKDNIKRINPFIKINAIVEKIEEGNIEELFNGADIIIEAFDNPDYKALLSNFVLTKMKDKYLIASSGMAGYFSSNDIKTRRIMDKFYLCGDGENEAKEGSGLMAPRVSICANHMANMALKILINDVEV